MGRSRGATPGSRSASCAHHLSFLPRLETFPTNRGLGASVQPPSPRVRKSGTGREEGAWSRGEASPGVSSLGALEAEMGGKLTSCLDTCFEVLGR